jgi:hypothetical protein
MEYFWLVQDYNGHMNVFALAWALNVWYADETNELMEYPSHEIGARDHA